MKKKNSLMKCFFTLLILIISIHLIAQNSKLGDSLVSIGQYQKAIVEYKKEKQPDLYKIAKAFEAIDNYDESGRKNFTAKKFRKIFK